jgi:hypothetical protein
MLANHVDNFIRVRGIRIDVCRGQVAWSEPKLAQRWKWSRGKVRRYLNELETVQQIVQQTNNQTSIITIVNYDEYQQNGTANGTTDEQQTVQQTDSKRYTIKELKNEKKERKDPPSEKFTAEDRGLAELHRDLILAVNPSAKTPENLDKWADSYRLMRERDRRDPVRTAEILRWIFTDPTCWPGWKTNILSADKFREKYDKLNMQMGQKPVEKKPLRLVENVTCSCWPRPGMREEKDDQGRVRARVCVGCGKTLERYE